MKFGYHFYNWDWDWKERLDLKLELTAKTGWAGFEAKPKEIGIGPEELGKKCKQYSVECAAIGGGFKEAADYASQAGVKIIRSHPPEEGFSDYMRYADDLGLTVVIHNHLSVATRGRGAVETREDLLRYLDNHPGTTACPDTGHLLLCGSDPAETILDLAERCKYVHLKDIVPEAVGKMDGTGEEFCDIGKGALDIDAVFAALKKIGYDGWIMVERDARVSDYEESARSMRRVLQKYGF
jgi:sugar phosphate isomerase/epimerase